MITFRDFLKQRGFFEGGTKEQVEAARKEYKRLYNREYYYQRKGKKKKLVLYLPAAEYARFVRIAKKHKMPTSRFIVQSSNAYLDEVYVVPDEQATRDLEILLKRYTSLLNQHVYVENMTMISNPKLNGIIMAQVTDISKSLTRLYRDPIKADQYLMMILEKTPEYIPRLWCQLNNLMSEYGYKVDEKQATPVSGESGIYSQR